MSVKALVPKRACPLALQKKIINQIFNGFSSFECFRTLQQQMNLKTLQQQINSKKIKPLN